MAVSGCPKKRRRTLVVDSIIWVKLLGDDALFQGLYVSSLDVLPWIAPQLFGGFRRLFTAYGRCRATETESEWVAVALIVNNHCILISLRYRQFRRYRMIGLVLLLTVPPHPLLALQPLFALRARKQTGLA